MKTELKANEIVIVGDTVQFGSMFSIALSELLVDNAILASIEAVEADEGDGIEQPIVGAPPYHVKGNDFIFQLDNFRDRSPRTLGLLILAVLEFRLPNHPLVNILNDAL